MSSEVSGDEVNLNAITQGSDIDSGVPQGHLLSRLVELALSNLPEDKEALRITREEISQVLGDAALVDAAAVIGNFQKMVRIADGTGIPLDKPLAIISADIREQMGFNKFGSANLTPKVGKLVTWLAARFRPLIAKKMTKM